jgi:hypothetical protein
MEDDMNDRRWQKIAAASGFAALAFGAGAVPDLQW